MTVDEIDARAQALVAGLPASLSAEILDGRSAIGGGSAPDVELPTRLVALAHATMPAAALEAALRRAGTPVIARIQDDRVLLDLRTVREDEDSTLARALAAL